MLERVQVYKNLRQAFSNCIFVVCLELYQKLVNNEVKGVNDWFFSEDKPKLHLVKHVSLIAIH
jgi:hypothetical protein